MFLLIAMLCLQVSEIDNFFFTDPMCRSYFIGGWFGVLFIIFFIILRGLFAMYIVMCDQFTIRLGNRAGRKAIGMSDM